MAAEPVRWNHNLCYHPVILAAVLEGCLRALDVGCGEGILARELSQRSARVVAIDRDEPSIALARSHRDGVEYICGDCLDYGLEPASFDFIASVAVLHHLDARAGLDRMRELLRPGARSPSSGAPAPPRSRTCPSNPAGPWRTGC